MKLKIRKVEVTPDEFFNAVTDILKVAERIPQKEYLGTQLDYVCKELGLKSLEFWKMKFENEKEFERRFVLENFIISHKTFFSIWRKEKHTQISKLRK